MKTILSLVVMVCVFVSSAMMRGWHVCAAEAPAATPAPAAPSSAGPAPSAKAAAPAKTTSTAAKPGPCSARSIRYGWKPGHSYTYHVTANTQRSDSEENLDGTVVYAVKSVGPDGRANVTCTETFSSARKNCATFAAQPSAQGGHAFSFEHHSSGEETATISSSPEHIEIDRYGRILGAAGGGNLPFPVGRISHQAIEPLSAVDENVWTVTGDVGITLTESAGMPFSPPPDRGEEPLPAREKTIYTIKDSHGTSISVRKTYGFATAAEVDGEPLLNVTGEGELTFDRQSGVFTSSTMKLRVTLHEDGSPVQLASMVNCNLVRVAQEPSKAP